MKTLKLIFITGVMMLCMNVQARHKTIRLDEAAIRYDPLHKQFVLYNVSVGEDTEDMPDAFIRILIETGDGNYIIDTASYSDLEDDHEQAFPRTGTFVYRLQGSYNVNATVVKTYDKGGPRARLLTINGLTPTADPRPGSGLNYPAAAVTLTFFDQVVVPDDIMTGIITVNNAYLQRSSTELVLNLDTLLYVSNVRTSTGRVTFGDPVRNQYFNTYRISLGTIPNNGIVNIFFSVLPSIAVGDLSSTDRVYYELAGHTAKSTLSIARSHDPNSIELLPNCQQPTSDVLTFAVNIQNDGLAPEDDITVGLKFSDQQFVRNSINANDIFAMFAGRRRDAVAVISRPQLGSELNNSKIIISFKNERLEGINRWPTGHPNTRARIIFKLKLPPGVSKDDLLHIRAVVTFGKGNEPTETPMFEFTRRQIEALCIANSRCQGRRHCPVCVQVGAPGMVDAWYCK